MFADGALAPDSQRLEAARAAWADLVGPGPTLTTAERHVVIATARAAWAGAPAPAGGSPVVAAAHRMAFDAVGMDRDVVAGYETAGLDRFRYTEVVGIVGRLANVDFYATGLGASLPELPGADDAGPTGDVAADAAVAEGLVPATGKLSALAVLDALPADAASYRALHEPFYIPFREFMNAGYADELTRAQIEFVASRTSALNECFY